MSFGKTYLVLRDSRAVVVSSQDVPAPVASSPSVSVSTPKTLSIPKIGVVSQVEPVGQDMQGEMDVPKSAAGVGWYNLGPKPGEVGSAVIDGHLDDIYGRPAVFWDLDRLSANDEMSVTDNAGKEYKFVVVDKQSYPFDRFPLEKVFDTNDKPRLNLITCEGVWNPASRNYSNRLVVYARLKG